MELDAKKTPNNANNTSLYQISCSDVPDELFDRVAAKVYFQQFGRVIRMFLRPKSKTCTIEYDSAESAERALQKSGTYKDKKFFVGSTEKKPRIKKKRPSKSEEQLDPTWPIDSEVQKELEAMTDAFTATRKYVLRPEAMKVDSPPEPVKAVKKTMQKKVLKKAAIKSKTPDAKPAAKNETKKAAKPISVVDTAVVADLLNVIKQPAHTADEKFRVLEARDKLIRMHTVKQVDIAKAAKTVGTCPDMCPEKERLMRESQHQVASYEQTTNSRGEHCMNHRTAIKQYSRSSADQDVPLPHELRPVDVLHLSMNYILLKLADLCDTPDVNLAEWYHFIWDRTRGIRKDITQQELCCGRSVELVERCARFHVHCSARLVAEDVSVFDQKINTENLTKCLQTLKYMYHDLELEGEKCPNEAEFRAYIVLLNLNDGNFMWEVKNLRAEIQKSPEVRFAVRVFFAIDNNNYVSFFKLVRSATYLNACILLRYFNQVRYRALERILWTHSPRTTSATMAVEELRHMLAFEDAESTVSFLKYHGLSLDAAQSNHVVLDRRSLVDPTVPYASQRAVNVIESKRSDSVGEIVYGSKLPSIDFDSHVPYDSFDENGFLKKSEIDESWKNHPFKSQPAPRAEPDVQDKAAKPLFAKNDDWDSPPSTDKVDPSVKTTVQGPPAVSSARTPPESKRPATGDAPRRNSPILRPESNIFAARPGGSGFPGRFPAFVTSNQPFMTSNQPFMAARPASAVPNIFRSTVPFRFVPNQTKSGEAHEPKSDDRDARSEKVDERPQPTNIFRVPPKPLDVYTFSEPDSNVLSPPVSFAQKVPPKDPGTTRTSFTESFSKPITQPKRDAESAGFTFELEKPKASAAAERLEGEAERIEKQRRERERIEKEKEEKRRIAEEEERKRKVKEEEEKRRREEERKNVERKRIEEERRRLEEVRRDAEARARTRQIEIQRQRAEQERRQEIERIVCVKTLIDELVAKTEEADRTRRLGEIRRNLETIALREAIGKWRRRVSLMKRKRKAVDDLPTWLSRRSIVEEAAELRSNSQRLVLGDMKRYKLGTPATLVVPDFPTARRIDVEALVRDILRTRLNNRTRMVNSLFWSVKISLPDRRESYEEADRLEEVVNVALGITEPDKPTVVYRTEAYGSFAVAVEKQAGAFRGVLDEKFDALFVGVDDSGSLYSLRGRLSSALKRKSELDPIPIVVVLRRGRDPTDVESIVDLLELRALRARGVISSYEILYDETGTDESLSARIDEGLRELAARTTDPPPLEVDHFRSVLCNCVGTELGDRLKSCTRTNRKFASLLSTPRVVVDIHNEAISKLCEIVADDVSGYPRFPAVFDGYLDERTAFPRGYEHVSDYLLGRPYRDDVVASLEALMIPEFEDEWPPKDINGLHGALKRFCERSVRTPTCGNLFLRVWASVLRHLENSTGPAWTDRLDGFPWLDIVQTVVSEKMNRLDYNVRAADGARPSFKTVVYDRSAMTQFRNDYWWYEMDAVSVLIRSIDEPDEDVGDDGESDDGSKIEFDLDRSLAEATVAGLDACDRANTVDYVGFKRMLNDLETSISIQKRAQQKFDDILKREVAGFSSK